MFRVKSFASRGVINLPSERVLCVRVTVGERLGLLHWFLDGLEEAVVGAYTGRFIRHEIARSVEVDLLGHTERERRRQREVPQGGQDGVSSAQLRHYLQRFPKRARGSVPAT
jgi:hypothetical protein